MKNLLVSRLFLFTFSLIIISFLTSCGITSAIKNATGQIESATSSFDRAIAALGQESANWRAVMYDLEKEISEDVQSTIRTEIENLTRSAILTAGGEFRCNSEFLRMRLERELIRIRNNFAKEINIQLAQIPGYSYQVPLVPEKPAEPVICSVVPSAVDLDLDPKRRPKIEVFGFDLRSLPINVAIINYGVLTMKKAMDFKNFKDLIKAYPGRISERKVVNDFFVFDQPSKRLKKDITNALSIISDYHAVLDLTESGVNIGPNAQEIVFNWNNQVKSEIAILSRQQFLTCEVISKPFTPPWKTFRPLALEDNACKGKPDKDFADHGPCVRFSFSLNLDPERKIITASYWMDAWECPDDFGFYKKDCTEAEGWGSFEVFKAEDNEKIVGYDVQSYIYYEYIDDDWEDDHHYYSGTEPFTELKFVGDTDGNEAGTRTEVVMKFRQINIKVEKCELE